MSRLLVLVAAALLARAAEAMVVDAFAARVDEGVVTWSQVLQEIEIRKLAGRTGEALGGPVVQAALVRRRLLVAEAEKLRLEVGANQIREAVEALAARSGGGKFWGQIGRIGLDRTGVERRAREMILEQRYLVLRREMTFVPESEIRAFYLENREQFGARPLAEVRDEVRAHLAEQAYEKELEEWIDRQRQEGRVTLYPLPAEG